mmetsp:Transcript_18537/g.35305  ORF Transcript_18537/g.35305 Transcript_18537/m.35305 type:complete len:208 (-) Transcript_18537:636-1259(-)
MQTALQPRLVLDLTRGFDVERQPPQIVLNLGLCVVQLLHGGLSLVLAQQLHTFGDVRARRHRSLVTRHVVHLLLAVLQVHGHLSVVRVLLLGRPVRYLGQLLLGLANVLLAHRLRQILLHKVAAVLRVGRGARRARRAARAGRARPVGDGDLADRVVLANNLARQLLLMILGAGLLDGDTIVAGVVPGNDSLALLKIANSIHWIEEG